MRGGFDSADGAASEPAPPFPIVAATLARTPSFWLLSFGAASGSILGYGLIFWLPSFFSRSFDLELAEVGWFYGSIVLVGGVAGTWLGGWLGDRTGPGNPGAYALIPAICFLIAAPVLRARPVRAVAVARLDPVRDRPDAGAGLARPGDRRGPAHRPAQHARDRLAPASCSSTI